MGCWDCIWNPKTFLGCFSLKTGTLILAIIDFISFAFSYNAKIKNNGTFFAILGSVIMLFVTAFGIYGAYKNKRAYLQVYEGYLYFAAIVSVIFAVLSIFSFSLSIIISSLFTMLISLYACRVVRNCYSQMDYEKRYGNNTGAINAV